MKYINAMTLTILLALTRISGEPVHLDARSKLWLIGDSTLHAYTSSTSDLTIDSSASVYEDIRTGKMTTLDVRIPVKSLKSGKSQLDQNMQKALKEKEHPHIIFHLTRYEVTASTSDKSFPITTYGDLTVAGQTKTIELPAVVSMGDFTRIEGTKDLLMSDFGVKPPTVMGIIKTHNRVVINFDLYYRGGLYD